MSRYLLAVLLIALPSFAQRKPTQREVKIQKTSLSRDQEIQLGKEAAAEIERTLEVIQNQEIEAWLNNIGQRLAKTPQANSYPYYFKLVNDDSINAFALPGGPMYVHTGLIRAADNEGQVAGVLAHEMSHVALRHGASQMSKAQTWQTILGVAGAAAGIAGGGTCGLLCQAVQIGGGLGANSLLSKFSRDMERDADLNGARMTAQVGYNPIEVARFFEKLEAQMGSASRPRGLEAWLSSHPAPGRRVEYVKEDIAFYAPREYGFNTGQFERVRASVAKLPPPKKKPAALLQPVQSSARPGLPEGFLDLHTQGFAIAYPSGWQAGQAKAGGSLFIVPKGGVKQGQNGSVELLAGAMIDYFQPRSGEVNLRRTTNEFLNLLKQGDPNLQLEDTQSTQVGGQPALVSKIRTKTSAQQEPDQIVWLYTVARDEGLWNIACAAPPSRATDAENVFRRMMQSIQFKN